MSVQTCSHCKVPYWRFRGDHPPKGTCSLTCHDAKKEGQRDNTPPLPENALRAMVEHRSQKHGCPDILAWYDCETCEKLEKVYADAIEWHVDRITREIVSEARA